MPGTNLPGVVTYRDLDDVNAMLLAAEAGGQRRGDRRRPARAEAAAGLAERGMEVTVVHLMPTLMERQLDPAAGYLLQGAMEARGIEVLTKANTKAILEQDGRVAGVLLEDGRTLPADLVVMAVGIRPNARAGQGCGPDGQSRHRGRRRMRTCDPDVFAVGECVEHRGQCYGLVAPLYEMAKVVAAQLADDPAPRFKARSPSHQAQGHRHRPVLGRRFRRRRRTARRSCCATPRAASTSASS